MKKREIMLWLKNLDLFLKTLRIEYKEEEPLFPYTTIKIGGKALRILFPDQMEKMVKLLRFLEDEGIPFFVMGEGSNLLVSDEGFRGVVIVTRKLRGLEELSQGEVLKVSALAGTPINSLLRFILERGYRGLEFLGGIPATLGGAVRMNAGAFGKTISQLVKKVFLYHKGEIREIIPKEEDWGYRSFRVEGIILSCELEFIKDSSNQIRKRVREIWERRRKTQPVQEKTFGSVFKNPPCCYAGALIEQVGLKGYQIGGAKISEKHANFIVNLGSAKCADVLALIKLAKDLVYKQFSIELEPEVKFLGLRKKKNMY